MDKKLHSREIPMASDYEGLKKIGLSYIRNASRKTWTDFGEHDPGVTMLEQLCFALVDLGYRTSFDLKDIMADMPRGESLVSPESVLSCSPVTIDDYRKLILEHFRGKVRNVHLSRKDTSLSFDKTLARKTGVESVDVAGCYRVQFELQDAYYSKKEEVLGEVKAFLNDGYRNLCESFDFSDSSRNDAVLHKLSVGIHAKITIDREVRYDRLTRDIEKALRDYVTPSIPYHSFEELVEKGMTLEEIFQGANPPDMDSFVTYEDLARLGRRNQLFLSDIKNIILSQKGVRSISHLRFILPEGERRAVVKNECLMLTDDMSVFCLEPFNFDARSLTAIAYVINGIPFQVGKNIRYSSEDAGSDQPSLPEGRPLSIVPEEGKYRESDVYLSPQNEFPAIYQIGRDEANEHDPEERKAMRLQLKAYLTFFDQLLSDYLEQLTKVGQYLSWDVETPTYYHHVLTDEEISDVSLVLGHYSGYEDGLDEDTILERKNAVMDHLLARFNEVFVDYSLFRYVSGNDKLDFNLKDAVADKSRYLASFTGTSSLRSQGARLSSFSADPSLWHYGALENRIAKKLGINKMPDVLSVLEGDREESFNESFGLHILEHNLLVPSGTSHLRPDNFLRLVLDDDPERYAADPYTAQVTVVLPGWMRITRHSYFRAIVEKLVIENIPAHISVKICWLSREVMSDIETAYPKYVASLLTGNNKKVAANLSAVLEVMSRFRNIYPMSIVYDHDGMLIDADHDDITELDFSAIGESVAEGVSGPVISPSSISMEVGRMLTLSLLISPENADTSVFEWHSSRKDVAVVDRQGRVFSLSCGESVISCSDGAGHVSQCVLKVVPATCFSKIDKPYGVKFEKEEVHCPMWSYYTKNRIRAYTFPPGSNNDVIFDSLDPGIAKVFGGLTTVVDYITPVAPGETWLVAKTASGAFADFCKVTVEGLRPGDVEMRVTTDVFVRNTVGKIQILCKDGASISGTILESSDPSVICLTDDMGSFKTLALGKSTITLAYPGQEPLCSITLSVNKNLYLCNLEPRESEPLEIRKVGWSQRINFILNPAQDRVLQNLTVTSSDESVITCRALTPALFEGMLTYGVMVTAVGNGRATVTVEDEDGYARTGSLEIIVCEADSSVTGVVLTEHELEVLISDIGFRCKRLTAKVLPPEASQNVYFESADPGIASVDPILTTSINYVDPVSPGETTITVWDESRRFSDTMKVIVKGLLKPGDVTLCSEKTEYVVGDEIYVYIKGPDEADTTGCHLWSSDPAILRMDGGNKGITAISAGTVTVFLGYYGQPITSLELKISDPVLAKQIVFVNEGQFKMYGTLGMEDRLMWYFTPEEPTDPRVTIASSDESVATCWTTGSVLDQDGRRVHVSMVNPVANGRAVITITTLDGLVSASKEVQVGLPEPTGIELDVHELEISMRDSGYNSKKLTAKVLPEDASQNVYFESADPGIASVDPILTTSINYVEPVCPGETTIFVWDEKRRFSDTCRVIVRGIKLENARIESVHTEYPVGVSSKFWLHSYGKDTSGCAFQSSDPSVLRITDICGDFKTLSPGTVEITFGYPGLEPFASLTVKVVDNSYQEEETDAPDSIELKESRMTVRKGEVFSIPFSVKPDGFEWKPEKGYFASSNESVLSVPDQHSNEIKAVECGYAQIDISYTSRAVAGCVIIVCPTECDPKTFVPVESFQLAEPYSPYLKVGEKRKLRFDFKPENATRVLSMTSSDESVLRTDASDFSVKAIAPGKADVVVRSYHFPWPVNLSFEVGEKAALSLPERVEIDMNEGYGGINPIYPEIGEQVAKSRVNYEVDNDAVVRACGIVDDAGRDCVNIIALFPGEAVVTARLASYPDIKSNPCRVIVKGLKPGDAELHSPRMDYQVGASGKMWVTRVNEKSLSDGLEFKTSDPEILEFTQPGGWFKTLSPGLVVVSYGYPGHEPLSSLEIRVIGSTRKESLSAKKKEAIGEVLALLLAKDNEDK